MNFEYIPDGDLGIVNLSGEKSFQDAKDAWERIRLAIRDDSLSAILMFDTATSFLKAHEIIELEHWISQNNFPRTVKIAIVDVRPASKTNNWFGETVARNRGWYYISVFSDEMSAINWLGIPKETCPLRNGETIEN